MANKNSDPEEGSSKFSRVTTTVLDLVAALRMFFVEIKENFLEQADGVLRRTQYLFVVYLWISAGLFLLVLGLFFLVIDLAQVPRGVVFSIGGMLVFLTAVIFLQAAKIKKFKR